MDFSFLSRENQAPPLLALTIDRLIWLFIFWAKVKGATDSLLCIGGANAHLQDFLYKRFDPISSPDMEYGRSELHWATQHQRPLNWSVFLEVSSPYRGATTFSAFLCETISRREQMAAQAPEPHPRQDAPLGREKLAASRKQKSGSGPGNCAPPHHAEA